MSRKRPLKMCTVSAEQWENYQRVALAALDFLRASAAASGPKDGAVVMRRLANVSEAESHLRERVIELWPETEARLNWK